MQMCQDIIEHLLTERDLLRRVMTDDETWIFEYNPETKRQRCQWKSSTSLRPKKARQSKSKVKIKSQSHVDHVLRYERHGPQ